MKGRFRAVALLAVACLAAADALAQYNRYEAQYGDPVDVSIDDLINTPTAYSNRAIRTRGNLEMFAGGSEMRPSFRGTFGNYVLLYAVPDVQFEWEQESKRWFGREVEVTGAFQETSESSSGRVYYRIVLWAYLGPPDKEPPKDLKSQLVTLEDLVSRPGKLDGKVVHVIGKFRGHNLYGDLPSRSQRKSSDWVIKDDVYAVWVTDRRAKGDGWALDPKMKRDTGKWLDVVGRPTTIGGVTYIQAIQLSLATPPEDKKLADVAPPPPPPERPKVPPMVVFSLPLDGDREVTSTERFAIQFSKDMNETSFEGRVLLRYAGRPQPGDRAFDAARISYDGGRRALMVDPGDVLRTGRVLELILLPGIVDLDGLPLETRQGKQVGRAADVLRYQVAF